MSYHGGRPPDPYAGGVSPARFPAPAATTSLTLAVALCLALLTSVTPAGAASPAPGRAAADDATAHLLSANRLPSLSGTAGWREVHTGEEGGAPVGACNRATFEDLGALEVVRRSFASPRGRAVQLVAEFADGESAWRAHGVLAAWRRDCAEWLSHPFERVGPMRPVPVRVGTADAYTTRFGDRARASRRAAGFGVVRQGRFVSAIHLVTPDRELSGRARGVHAPARLAVRRIAHTFH